MIAALFPGQNSHTIGMGIEFADAYEVARAVFANAENLIPGLTTLMREGPLETLTLTANQQPALVTASIAAYRVWLERTGKRPRYAAGHSLGEFSAHVAAGSLTLTDALKLVRARGTYMQEAVPEGQGAMAAIMGDPDTVLDACLKTPGVVDVANYNAPTQTVISGESASVEEACVLLKASGLKVIPLKVSAPFHCSLMAPARERLERDLEQTMFKALEFPVVANVTAHEVTNPGEIGALLSEQVTGSVRWVESIHRLAALGVTEFLEFGSGTVLTGLVKRILPEAKLFNIRTPADVEAYIAGS